MSSNFATISLLVSREKVAGNGSSEVAVVRRHLTDGGRDRSGSCQAPSAAEIVAAAHACVGGRPGISQGRPIVLRLQRLDSPGPRTRRRFVSGSFSDTYWVETQSKGREPGFLWSRPRRTRPRYSCDRESDRETLSRLCAAQGSRGASFVAMHRSQTISPVLMKCPAIAELFAQSSASFCLCAGVSLLSIVSFRW